MTVTCSVPAALADSLRRVAAVDPAATDLLRDELGDLLAPLDRSPWPEVAWRFSRLTGNGFPVELAFTSDGDEVRATCEVAGPEVDDSRRLDRAVDILRARQVEVPSEISTALRRLQRGAALRWGAWLSVRCGAAGTRFKLYAEAPVDAVVAWSPPPAADAELCMIGWDATHGVDELYYGLPGTEPTVVDSILSRCALGSRTAELLTMIESCSGRSAALVLASRQVGCSVVVAPDGTPLVAALLITAQALFGGESTIRSGLLAAAARHGWDFDRYAAASEPSLRRGPPELVHGVVAFAVAPDQPIRTQIGLSPMADVPPRSSP